MYRVWTFLANYSLLLVIGALVALVWANVDAHSYHAMVDFVPFSGLPGANLHFLVNDVFMAFFFFVAGKEVWEAVILKEGELRGRKSLTPLIATAGGMLGPVAIYFAYLAFMGSDTMAAMRQGWAIPTATDIAFSYLIGRIVFGAGHPAIRFLLLLAIADDAGGLLILAVFYPTSELAPIWLLLSVGAALAAYGLFNWLPRYLDRDDDLQRRSRWVRTNFNFLPYAIAGAASWYAFYRAGIHPALGLIPIIPAIPHADHNFGIYAEAEKYLKDLLNQIEHMLAAPVQVILFFFGLTNAGVALSAVDHATWAVLAGLLLGKPLGIFLFGFFAARVLGLGLPVGMRMSDLVVLGSVAGIGFTVALFVASVAFPGGEIQDAAKMGALLSFGSALIAIVLGRLFKVEKVAINRA
ncbi:MAG: Na+/H+ antiporter NhaA [Deltaproteobacteria bacterium]